jgi:hypothetical protein
MSDSHGNLREQAHRAPLAHCWRLMLTAVFFAFGSFWLLQAIQSRCDPGGAATPERTRLHRREFQLRAHDRKRLAALRDVGRAPGAPSGQRRLRSDQAGVESMAPGRPRMTMHADRGQVYHGETASN